MQCSLKYFLYFCIAKSGVVFGFDSKVNDCVSMSGNVDNPVKLFLRPN